MKEIEDKAMIGIMLNMVLAMVNAIGSTLACFTIDNLGRRYVILRCVPIVLVALIIVSCSMGINTYSEDEDEKFKGHVFFFTGVILYLAFYAIGFFSTPWAINAEIFPVHLIGTAVSIGSAANWIMSFFVGSIFLTVMDSDSGKVYAFLILAAFCVLAWVFTYFFVPETAGKPIEENIYNIIGEDLFPEEYVEYEEYADQEPGNSPAIMI